MKHAAEKYLDCTIYKDDYSLELRKTFSRKEYGIGLEEVVTGLNKEAIDKTAELEEGIYLEVKEGEVLFRSAEIDFIDESGNFLCSRKKDDAGEITLSEWIEKIDDKDVTMETAIKFLLSLSRVDGFTDGIESELYNHLDGYLDHYLSYDGREIGLSRASYFLQIHNLEESQKDEIYSIFKGLMTIHFNQYMNYLKGVRLPNGENHFPRNYYPRIFKKFDPITNQNKEVLNNRKHYISACARVLTNLLLENLYNGRER